MPKVVFHYFSGTGNTLHVTQRIAERFQEAGYDATFVPIEKTRIPQQQSGDLHLFLFPVYACAVPHIMRRYLHHLPNGEGVKTAVISTNGRISTRWRDGYEGQALMQAHRMLRRRGYDVFLTDTLDYPHSITNLLNPPRPEAQAEIIRQAGIRLETIIQKLLHRETSIRRCHILNHLWSWVFGWSYTLLGRHLLGKLYVADRACTACGQCVRSCPVNAITMIGQKPWWKWHCEGCERCINSCPVAAIQTSAIRLLFLVGLMFYNPLEGVYRFIPQGIYPLLGSLGTWLFKNVLELILYVLAFYLLDWIIFLLSRIPGVRRVFEWSYTKRFRRYLAPGVQPRSNAT